MGTLTFVAIEPDRKCCDYWGMGGAADLRINDDASARPPVVPTRLGRELRARPELPVVSQVGAGALVALVAVAVRYALPLSPQQLPTITIVVSLALVTTFVGLPAGIATAVIGGTLSWYFFFNPMSWSLANGSWIPLVGFSVIATVIISTAGLYRVSERARHETEMAELEAERANAELFAREMAHRLKNALTIVQSIAFQTIGSDSPEARTFAGRLRALSDANGLLTEHVQHPSAKATEIIASALAPFDDKKAHVEIRGIDALLNGTQAVSLALSIHELATNAVKYGALSHPDGQVTVELQAIDDRHFCIWKETGGPLVTPPAHSGFGTRLLKRSGTATELNWAPEGLQCTIELRTA